MMFICVKIKRKKYRVRKFIFKFVFSGVLKELVDTCYDIENKFTRVESLIQGDYSESIKCQYDSYKKHELDLSHEKILKIIYTEFVELQGESRILAKKLASIREGFLSS